ncbi:large conductance mechanosensitive channel protein MscL [Rathayibacter sp. YIM 133350]|uniref:large conductance mechanosensitive channel protein MscL n=1 Tax=Rathayibacter sp. YIM 133350 TaxID=3131992 RepID=UPI00307F1796
MLKGFRDFIIRGNVIDLAVAVVIGAAFTAVVNSIVTNIFNPLIGAIFQSDSLNSLTWTIPGTKAEIGYGAVLGAIITFLIVATVVYFVFVLPINTLKAAQERRRRAGVEPSAAAATELDRLTEIRDLLAVQARQRD